MPSTTDCTGHPTLETKLQNERLANQYPISEDSPELYYFGDRIRDAYKDDIRGLDNFRTHLQEMYKSYIYQNIVHLTADEVQVGLRKFTVPPNAIQIHDLRNATQYVGARGLSSKVVKSGRGVMKFVLELSFPDKETVNKELRGLIADFKTTPFTTIRSPFIADAIAIRKLPSEKKPDEGLSKQEQVIQALRGKLRDYLLRPAKIASGIDLGTKYKAEVVTNLELLSNDVLSRLTEKLDNERTEFSNIVAAVNTATIELSISIKDIVNNFRNELGQPIPDNIRKLLYLNVEEEFDITHKLISSDLRALANDIHKNVSDHDLKSNIDRGLRQAPIPVALEELTVQFSEGTETVSAKLTLILFNHTPYVPEFMYKNIDGDKTLYIEQAAYLNRHTAMRFLEGSYHPVIGTEDKPVADSLYHQTLGRLGSTPGRFTVMYLGNRVPINKDSLQGSDRDRRYQVLELNSTDGHSVVSNIVVTMNNFFAFQQVQSSEYATMQYMGGQSIEAVVEVATTNPESLWLMNHLRHATDLQNNTQKPDRSDNAMIYLNNEILSLFNIKRATLTNMTKTPSGPQETRVSLEFLDQSTRDFGTTLKSTITESESWEWKQNVATGAITKLASLLYSVPRMIRNILLGDDGDIVIYEGKKTWKEDLGMLTSDYTTISKLPNKGLDLLLDQGFGVISVNLLAEWIYQQQTNGSMRSIFGKESLVAGLNEFISWIESDKENFKLVKEYSNYVTLYLRPTISQDITDLISKQSRGWEAILNRYSLSGIGDFYDDTEQLNLSQNLKARRLVSYLIAQLFLVKLLTADESIRFNPVDPKYSFGPDLLTSDILTYPSTYHEPKLTALYSYLERGLDATFPFWKGRENFSFYNIDHIKTVFSNYMHWLERNHPEVFNLFLPEENRTIPRRSDSSGIKEELLQALYPDAPVDPYPDLSLTTYADIFGVPGYELEDLLEDQKYWSFFSKFIPTFGLIGKKPPGSLSTYSFARTAQHRIEPDFWWYTWTIKNEILDRVQGLHKENVGISDHGHVVTDAQKPKDIIIKTAEGEEVIRSGINPIYVEEVRRQGEPGVPFYASVTEEVSNMEEFQRMVYAFPTATIKFIWEGKRISKPNNRTEPAESFRAHVYLRLPVDSINIRTRKKKIKVAELSFAGSPSLMTNDKFVFVDDPDLIQLGKVFSEQLLNVFESTNLTTPSQGTFSTYPLGISGNIGDLILNGSINGDSGSGMRNDMYYLRNQIFREGTRVTVRIGYGSMINDIPVRFTGTITEYNAEDRIQMVCQSYDAQLLMPMPITISAGGDADVLMRFLDTSFKYFNERGGTRFLGGFRNDPMGMVKIGYREESNLRAILPLEVASESSFQTDYRNIYSGLTNNPNLSTNGTLYTAQKNLRTTLSNWITAAVTGAQIVGGFATEFPETKEAIQEVYAKSGKFTEATLGGVMDWLDSAFGFTQLDNLNGECINCYIPTNSWWNRFWSGGDSIEGRDRSFHVILDEIIKRYPGYVWYFDYFDDEMRLFIGRPQQKYFYTARAEHKRTETDTWYYRQVASRRRVIVSVIQEILKGYQTFYSLDTLSSDKKLLYLGKLDGILWHKNRWWMEESELEVVKKEFQRRFGEENPAQDTLLETSALPIGEDIQGAYRDIISLIGKEAFRIVLKEFFGVRQREDKVWGFSVSVSNIEETVYDIEAENILEALDSQAWDTMFLNGLTLGGPGKSEEEPNENTIYENFGIANDITSDGLIAPDSGVSYHRKDDGTTIDNDTLEKAAAFLNKNIGQFRIFIKTFNKFLNEQQEIDLEKLDTAKVFSDLMSHPRQNTFQRSHFVTSFNGLMDNEIKTSAAHMYNGVTLFCGSDQETTLERWLSVRPEDRRIQFCFEPHIDANKSVVQLVANSWLAESLRPMYQGRIVMRGRNIKPYDIAYIMDWYNGLYGSVEVDEVTDIYGTESGYVTEIIPQLYVVPSATTEYYKHAVLSALVEYTGYTLLAGTVLVQFTPVAALGWVMAPMGGLLLADPKGLATAFSGVEDPNNTEINIVNPLRQLRDRIGMVHPRDMKISSDQEILKYTGEAKAEFGGIAMFPLMQMVARHSDGSVRGRPFITGLRGIEAYAWWDIGKGGIVRHFGEFLEDVWLGVTTWWSDKQKLAAIRTLAAYRIGGELFEADQITPAEKK